MEKLNIVLFGVDYSPEILAKVNSFRRGHIILRDDMRIAGNGRYDNGGVVHA
jgi:hypothetical protein